MTSAFNLLGIAMLRSTPNLLFTVNYIIDIFDIFKNPYHPIFQTKHSISDVMYYFFLGNLILPL